ncbi:hypothetical protein [Rhodocyclus purpureus]|uniref:hypothetical protein n=1 Tax=Rhodocyclus purpureus TaxID=1067 RepID=UPI001914062A|nr:hypothetical protein [Rhodocyclus purpureus]
MAFFRVPMHDSEEWECPYPFIIIEADDDYSAYESALGNLPTFFGDPVADGETAEDGHQGIVEIADPLAEPWPLFTQAFFLRELVQRQPAPSVVVDADA